MRLLNVSHNGIKLFCDLMDLENCLSKNVYKANDIYIASKAVFELVMKKAWKRKKRKMLRRKCLFKFNSFERKYIWL